MTWNGRLWGERASGQKSFEIRKWERHGHGPRLVKRDEFMTKREAARALRRLNVSALIVRRILSPAYLEDGTSGVTKASVDRDLEWKRTAGIWRRVWRRVTGVLRWI